MERRHLEGDSPEVDPRDSGHDLRPGGSCVGGFEDLPFRPAGDEEAHVAPPLIGRGINHVWIKGVEDDIRDPRVLRHMKNPLPAVASIGGLKEPPITTGRPKGPLRGGVDHIRVTRVHEDVPDMFGPLQTHVLK